MKNKRILVIMLVTLLVTVLQACDSKEEEKEYREFTYLPAIDHNEFQTKVNSGETFYVYIGRPDCGDSRQFNKEFEELLVNFDYDGNYVDVKYDLDEKISYFNIGEIIDATGSTEQREQYKELYGFYFTPSLVAYEDLDGDGKSEPANIAEWSAIHGFFISDYMNWFYENGLIIPNEEVFHEGESIKEVN